MALVALSIVAIYGTMFKDYERINHEILQRVVSATNALQIEVRNRATLAIQERKAQTTSTAAVQTSSHNISKSFESHKLTLKKYLRIPFVFLLRKSES